MNKQTEHARLNLLFRNSGALIDMLSKESLTGLKTLVHFQAVAYGIKLSQDFLQFNRGGNWNSLVTKHPCCQCEGLNWQMCVCTTRAPKVSLHCSANTAGPAIVKDNNFICCPLFVDAQDSSNCEGGKITKFKLTLASHSDFIAVSVLYLVLFKAEQLYRSTKPS